MSRAQRLSAVLSVVLCLATFVAISLVPSSDANAAWGFALLALIAAGVTAFLLRPKGLGRVPERPRPAETAPAAPVPVRRDPEPPAAARATVRAESPAVSRAVPSPGSLSKRMAAIEPDPLITLVEGNVEVIAELTRSLVGPERSEKVPVDHVIWRLGEVLERADVDMIDGEDAFDGLRHQAVDSAGQPDAGAPIAETVSPGFAIGRRVLLRASVRVAR